MQTAWTLDAYVGNTQLDLNGGAAGETYSYVTSPTNIRHIGLTATQTGSVGSLDNFLLTGPEPIPEPSQTLLTGLGVAGLLLSRRRRD